MALDPNMTVIELSPQEALLFVAFQRRYPVFNVLEQLGAFDMKNGSVTINYDANGAVSSVSLNKTLRPSAL